ncbi:MAG: histidine phosphotransferase family protein [Pseudomonadota bacterium]
MSVPVSQPVKPQEPTPDSAQALGALESMVRVSELLNSRICHDLISPVGAVNNGIELIAELGDSVRDEAMHLISGSALSAANRLAFYRLAYGSGAGKSRISVNDAREAAGNLFKLGKTELDWPRYLVVPFEREPAAVAKVMALVLLSAEEALPRGKIELACQEERMRVTFRLMGRDPGLSDQSRAALGEGAVIEDLTVRTVHSYLTGVALRQFGFFLTFDPVSTDRLDLHLGQR